METPLGRSTLCTRKKSEKRTLEKNAQRLGSAGFEGEEVMVGRICGQSAARR